MQIAGILGRAMATSVPMMALIAPRAWGQALPTLYVNARIGSDLNNGLSPIAAFQRITKGLEVAATNLSGPRTILIAGVATPLGQAIPYDDVVNGECFPLPMLSQVSLVWDETNSDDLPTFPPSKAAAVLRKTPPFGPVVRFSSATPTCPPAIGYSPGTAPVQLKGLVLEGGNPAIEIFDGPAGSVRPDLANVLVQDGLGCVDIVATTGDVSPTISASAFKRAPTSPATGYAQALVSLEVPGATATGTIGGTIANCTFSAVGTSSASQFTGSGVLGLLPNGRGRITTSVTDCLFAGSANTYGLHNGVRLELWHAPGVPDNPAAFEVAISDSTFLDCNTYGVDLLTVPAVGAGAGAKSSLSVTNCNLSQPGIPGSGVSGGQVTVDFGAGHSAAVTVSGCTFGESPRAGFSLDSSTPYTAAASPGDLYVNISQNEIHKQGGSGIHFKASSIALKGKVSRNTIFDGDAHGIVHGAEGGYTVGGPPHLSTSAAVDIVNNMIGYNQGNGIVNRVTNITGLGTVTATPRISFNTVAKNGMRGLENLAYGTATYQTFPVWDSIFLDNTGGDINTVALPEANVFWTRFGAAQYTAFPNFNTSLNPMLTNPANRDFSLQSGSPMIDRASSTPPALPAVDFFGDPRLRDHCGVGYDGPSCGGTSPNFADKGAQERRTP